MPIDTHPDPAKLEKYMKDNENNASLENQNNINLGNTLQNTNIYHANSNREIVFSTARVDNFPEQQQMDNINKPVASQSIILEPSNATYMEYSEIHGIMDLFFNLLFTFALGWVSAELSKKVRTGNN